MANTDDTSRSLATLPPGPADEAATRFGQWLEKHEALRPVRTSSGLLRVCAEAWYAGKEQQ